MARRISTLAQRVARQLALAAVIAVAIQSVWAVWSYQTPDEIGELEEDAVEWVLDALGARLQPDGTIDDFHPERYDFAAVRYAIVNPAGARVDGDLTVKPDLLRQVRRIHEIFLVDEHAGGNRWLGARRMRTRDGALLIILAEVHFRPGVYPLNILVAEVLETALFPTLPVIVLMYLVGVLAIRGASPGSSGRRARRARLIPSSAGGACRKPVCPLRRSVWSGPSTGASRRWRLSWPSSRPSRARWRMNCERRSPS
ncbi:hypothetical protein [Pedomonas mirosovicensis]|uniref:hypothetical protein n=1 Tax=Pedomonas mirosovicensis TaxID=2908641 RepID=UPI0021675249|nr:hypothetical protein [Pedomonas mirosovicensis]MCH8686789.1 hypothetical protein [Pedomonas mirosovicensis]